MQSKTFQIPNISCGHCVMTIKNEVSELTGVKKVDADKTTRMVTVEWDDPATWEQIQKLLVEINYAPSAESN
jgi:copper chaperone